MQSSVTEIVDSIWFSSSLEYKFNKLVIAVARNEQQGIHSQHVLVIYVYTSVQQHLDNVQISAAC